MQALKSRDISEKKLLLLAAVLTQFLSVLLTRKLKAETLLFTSPKLLPLLERPSMLLELRSACPTAPLGCNRARAACIPALAMFPQLGAGGRAWTEMQRLCWTLKSRRIKSFLLPLPSECLHFGFSSTQPVALTRSTEVSYCRHVLSCSQLTSSGLQRSLFLPAHSSHLQGEGSYTVLKFHKYKVRENTILPQPRGASGTIQ
ncbi:uncharacterized protein LOC110403276 [Numida meleagris]|uniref:uncharacterized protein LOC110403276 n=1 Tax=Numida meleagris TaxID=8996 RepID=UPI000B3D9B39|nr:uncharacterized protein LOC110403276 [Numida meleagris]